MFEDPPMTPEQRKAELEDIRHEPLLAQLCDDIRTEVPRDLPNCSDQEKELTDLDSQCREFLVQWRLCKDFHKRKNWTHIGSTEAGPRVAAIISIVESCRRLNIPIRH
jgi:hypothetical protein